MDGLNIAPKPNEPVACTLDAGDVDQRLREWAEVRSQARGVTELENGVAITFPASLAHRVHDLARQEAACCAFLAFESEITDDELTLHITSPDPGAQAIISALVGVEPESG